MLVNTNTGGIHREQSGQLTITALIGALNGLKDALRGAIG
jgi:hypothetical protein